jgi:hypothetical protein
MDVQEFWRLIDATRTVSERDMVKQATLLVGELVKLPIDSIVAYQQHLNRFCDLAYSNELWAAAYILNCGCGDDGFLDFLATGHQSKIWKKAG